MAAAEAVSVRADWLITVKPTVDVLLFCWVVGFTIAGVSVEDVETVWPVVAVEKCWVYGWVDWTGF